MKSLPTRILSALVALAIFILVYKFYETPGLIVVGFILCAGGAYEFQKIAFLPLQSPMIVRIWFMVTCLVILFLTLFSNIPLNPVWGVLMALHIAVVLWSLRDKTENDKLLMTFSLSTLGLLYCALLPTFALRILASQNGDLWFLFMCAVVFGGDILAYFGGLLLGKKKLMPRVSPNKTWAGSFSGLAGSVIAGCAVGAFGLKSVSLLPLAAVALAGGALAQSGDLFESLLKRVSNVKDSGQIMPGHGGILDRLDGVYFAAPFIYTAALYLNS